MIDKKILTGILASIGGSLCCITPVIAVLAGSTSMASTFSWLVPYRPYFITITILVLLYAWWDKLKPTKEGIDCACELDENAKVSFWHTKKFLAIVSIFSIIMLTVPYWGSVVINSTKSQKPKVVVVEKSNIVKSVIGIEGMTCSSCEATVEKVTSDIDGVLKIKASTPNKNAIVTYDNSKTNIEEIMKVIDETGYMTTSHKEL